jgi:hypothetical protein
MMNQQSRGYNFKALSALVLLAIVYSVVLRSLHTMSGANRPGGILGVLLGLYICSHPAANLFDILFFGRSSLHQPVSPRMQYLWLALNILVLLVGFWVIVLGTTRFTLPPVRKI